MTDPLPRLSVATCVEDFAGPGRVVKVFREQGCHVKFDNGWTVSIQWSPFHYCSNRTYDDFDVRAPSPDSTDAEVAAWKGEGSMIELGDDSVAGWQPIGAIKEALEAASRDDMDGVQAALTQERARV